MRHNLNQKIILVSAFNWVLQKDSFSNLNVVLVLGMTEGQTPQAYMFIDGNEMFCSDNPFRGSVFSRTCYASRERCDNEFFLFS